MSRPWHVVELSQARVDLVARCLTLATGAVLAIATTTLSESTGTFLLLGAVATSMTLLGARTAPHSLEYQIALVIEGVVACSVVLLASSASDVYLIYVAAPALLAGLRGGLYPGIAVVSGEVVAAAAIQFQAPESDRDLLVLWGPWVFMSLAVTLLGSWIRQLQLLQRDTRSSPYASAHHLLEQLRGVTRQLSGGLDIEVVSENVIDNALTQLAGTRAALLLVSESGDLSVIARRGGEGFTSSLGKDPSVLDAMTADGPTHTPVPTGRSQHRYRTWLPVRIGARPIGVVVVDGPVAVTSDELAEAQSHLDDDAMRIDSAILFGDVRALATVEERRRLAREIHDGIAQEIASLGYLVDDLARDQCNQRHQDGLIDLRVELTRVVTELRLSIFDLRSGVSTNAGLGSVLGDYVREVGKSSGMTVHMSLEESPTRLRLDVETELLRIAQEAITNARKHSHAANLWVECRVEPPFAEVRVEDDGTGLVKERAEHYGLHIMKERAQRINAVLAWAERSGGGTVVSAVLLPAEAAVSMEQIEHPEIPQSGDSYAVHRFAG